MVIVLDREGERQDEAAPLPAALPAAFAPEPLQDRLRRKGRRAAERTAQMMDGRIRIRWDRLGRWALLGVFALVLYLYIGPAVTWVQTYREAGRQRAQVAELRAENLRLRQRERALKAPGALEREARKLGMVKAGERAYVIEGLLAARR
jgi:cell division protein FtsB